MISMRHNDWFNRLTDGASGNAAAAKAEIPVASLNRHLANGRLTAEEVIALSRAYGESPVKGLAATGHITHEEAVGMDAAASADLISDPELIRTLAYRINADPEAWFGTFGELADVDSNTSTSNVHPLPYAANRRKAEPEEGDDDYGSGA